MQFTANFKNEDIMKILPSQGNDNSSKYRLPTNVRMDTQRETQQNEPIDMGSPVDRKKGRLIRSESNESVHEFINLYYLEEQ